MFMTIWCLILTAIVVVQGYMIIRLCEEVEALKTWKPFADLMGIEVPESYKRANKNQKGGEK